MSKAGDIAGGTIGVVITIIFVYLIVYNVIERFRRLVKDKVPKLGKISDAITDVITWPIRKIKDAFGRNRYNRMGGYSDYNRYGHGYRPYSLYSPGYSSW